MLVIREVFTAKPGQASKLAQLFKRAFSADTNAPTVRIMTDLVGNYNTVVMEMQVNSLVEFEKQMKEYSEGKMDPKTMEEMSKYTEMYATGRREIFQVVE
jgi:hypothetical protein